GSDLLGAHGFPAGLEDSGYGAGRSGASGAKPQRLDGSKPRSSPAQSFRRGKLLSGWSSMGGGFGRRPDGAAGAARAAQRSAVVPASRSQRVAYADCALERGTAGGAVGAHGRGGPLSQPQPRDFVAESKTARDVCGRPARGGAGGAGGRGQLVGSRAARGASFDGGHADAG